MINLYCLYFLILPVVSEYMVFGEKVHVTELLIYEEENITCWLLLVGDVANYELFSCINII